ncbi:MAG: reverse transcriptase-like protein [Proteobacteria bacterium]|nr:reverse transcriptase-like protein [Cystobacterineae bacterium]MCL2313898.1 reverse transcriptase-like protein [Pseudomonadota bacterium]
MPRKPTVAQLIRCIAQQEPLTKTRALFPRLSDKGLRAMLGQAAASLEANAVLPLEEILALPTEADVVAPAAPIAPHREAPAPLPPSSATATVASSGVASASGASGVATASGAVVSSPLKRPYMFLRIYSDGASRGNPGPAGAGAILEDEGGHRVKRLGRFLGKQTNNHAEYQGALLGLQAARALGATAVELLADSQLLIYQLQGRYRINSAGLLPLYREAKALLAQFSKVRLRHIPREENQEADEMSNEAIEKRLGV